MLGVPVSEMEPHGLVLPKHRLGMGKHPPYLYAPQSREEFAVQTIIFPHLLIGIHPLLPAEPEAGMGLLVLPGHRRLFGHECIQYGLIEPAVLEIENSH